MEPAGVVLEKRNVAVAAVAASKAETLALPVKQGGAAAAELAIAHPLIGLTGKSTYHTRRQAVATDNQTSVSIQELQKPRTRGPRERVNRS